MYLNPKDGAVQIVCDGCNKPLMEVAQDYVIVEGTEHYCPTCFEKKVRIDHYRERLKRMREIKK
jgi:Zn finger protein HypA/HybF involved in hydrogenase expression